LSNLPNSFADILEFLDGMKRWYPVGLGVEGTEQIELAATVVEETVSRIRAYVEWRSELPLPGCSLSSRRISARERVAAQPSRS